MVRYISYLNDLKLGNVPSLPARAVPAYLSELRPWDENYAGAERPLCALPTYPLCINNKWRVLLVWTVRETRHLLLTQRATYLT